VSLLGDHESLISPYQPVDPFFEWALSTPIVEALRDPAEGDLVAVGAEDSFVNGLMIVEKLRLRRSYYRTSGNSVSPVKRSACSRARSRCCRACGPEYERYAGVTGRLCARVVLKKVSNSEQVGVSSRTHTSIPPLARLDCSNVVPVPWVSRTESSHWRAT